MFFFFNDTATTEIYTLSLHDALPICVPPVAIRRVEHERARQRGVGDVRSEEHTSELQSPCNLVCRLLLEKKNNDNRPYPYTSNHTSPASPNLGLADFLPLMPMAPQAT